MIACSIVPSSIIYNDFKSESYFQESYDFHPLEHKQYLLAEINPSDIADDYSSLYSDLTSIINPLQESFNSFQVRQNITFDDPLIAFTNFIIPVFNNTIINNSSLTNLDLNNSRFEFVTLVEFNDFYRQKFINLFNVSQSDANNQSSSFFLTDNEINASDNANKIYLFQPFANFTSNSSLTVPLQRFITYDYSVFPEFSNLHVFSPNFLFIPNISEFLFHYYSSSNDTVYFGRGIEVSLSFTIKLSEIHYNEFKAIINKIISSFNVIHRNIIKLRYIQDIVVFDSFEYSSEGQLVGRIDRLSFSIVFMSIPLFLVSFLIVNFYFSSFSNTIRKKALFFKEKGLSTTKLFFLYCGLSIPLFVITASFATVVGLVVAIVAYSININFTVSFSMPDFSNIQFFDILFMTFICAILYTLFNFIPKIYNISKVKIFSILVLTDETEPFWKRHFYDYWLVGISLVFFILFYLVITYIPFLFIYFQIIIVPFPFFFVFGLVLMIVRIIPLIIAYIRNIFWNQNSHTLAISFQQILQLKSKFIHSFLLFSLLVCLLISYLIVPYTLNQQQLHDAKMYVGSDFQLTISSTEVNTSSNKNELKNYLFRSVLLNNSFSLNWDQEVYYRNDDYTEITGLNNSFFLKEFITSYPTQKLGFTKPVDQLLAELSNTTESFFKIIVSKGFANAHNYSIGDIINYDSKIGMKSIKFLIIDSFDFWPNFYDFKSDMSTKFIGITDFNNIEKFNNIFADQGFLFQNEIFKVNFKNFSIEQQNLVYVSIKEYFNQKGYYNTVPYYMDSVANILLEQRIMVEYKNIWNGVTIISLILILNILLVVSAFIFTIQNELLKDFAVLRAIGLNLNSLSIILFNIILVFSVTSVLSGFFVSTSGFYLLQWLLGSYQSAEVILVVPYYNLVIIFGLFLLLIILESLILIKVRNLSTIAELLRN
jgi:hypothetical protein